MTTFGYAHTLPVFNITTPVGQQPGPGNVIQSNGPDFDLTNLQITTGAVFGFRNHQYYFGELTQCQDLLPSPRALQQTDAQIQAEILAIFNTTSS
jgi:hypothetical protein